jgi:hypothetical protein
MNAKFEPRSGYETANSKGCAKRVYDGTRMDFGGHQCRRKAVKDGWCASHHPDAEKAKREKEEAKWKREREARELGYAIEKAEAQVVAAAMLLTIFTDGPEAQALKKATEKLRKLYAKQEGQ